MQSLDPRAGVTILKLFSLSLDATGKLARMFVPGWWLQPGVGVRLELTLLDNFLYNVIKHFMTVIYLCSFKGEFSLASFTSLV
jgi:hypothetical protein